jgi:hypothetical protein
LKRNELEPEILKRRIRRSFTIGGLVAILLLSSILYIHFSEKIGGAPKILRSSFQWNQTIAQKIFSESKKLSERKKPSSDQKIRVNGMLGLETPVFSQFYRVEVNSGIDNVYLPIDAFKVVPKTQYTTDFYCIEGWSEVFNYGGVKFSDFMEFYKVGKKVDGSYYQYVGFETPDHRYYVSIDMESMLHPQTVLAYEMNGKPLLPENGAPLRLVIPIKYGIKSLKRIGRIFFSDTRPPDYWAERGYDWYSGL